MRSSDCASCIAPSARVFGRDLVATMIGGPTRACAQSSPCGSNALSQERLTVSPDAHVPSPANSVPAGNYPRRSGANASVVS